MRSALRALLFAALLVTTGCLGLFGPDRPPSDQRAVDAVDRSVAALADVDTYRFSLDGEARASRGDEQVRVDVTGEGVVDVAGRRMNVTTRARDATRTVYVSNRTAYTECARMGWGRQNLSASTRWVNVTPAGEQFALLDRTDVYWRGTETVNRTEAAVVVAYPTKEELQSVARARGTELTDLSGANVQNVTVTVWIDAETNLPLKARRDVELKRNGVAGSATVTFRFSGYDEPATVTRPAFDEDSVWEMGCPGG